MKNILWTCQKPDAAELTVGQKFNINCVGPLQDLDATKMEFKLKNLSDEIPTLSLLQTMKFDEAGTELIVTSYRVGEHKPEDIILTDGKTQVEIQGLNWTVKSILKQDPTNPPQSFPTFPMQKVDYPIWAWMLLFLFVGLCVFLPYFQFKKIKKIKKAYDDLENLDSPLSPSDVFFKEMRRVEKNFELDLMSPMDFIAQSQNFFLIYLSRRLKVPFHMLPLSQSFRHFKRRHFRIHRDLGEDIRKYFSEIVKVQANFKKNDAKFLIENTQKIVESIENHFEKYEQRKTR